MTLAVSSLPFPPLWSGHLVQGYFVRGMYHTRDVYSKELWRHIVRRHIVMASFSLFYLYSAIVVMDFWWKNIGNVCMREGLIEKRLIPAPNLLIWGWLGSHIYHHSVFSGVLTTVFFFFHIILIYISTLFMCRQYRTHRA
jgi:hypothetical protein